MRLRSLLKPRLGLEVGWLLPSGDVTDTDGEGLVSNIEVGEQASSCCKYFVGLQEGGVDVRST